ncbi:hypothetical protein GQ55_2G341600 [Panicum hallii var. hallii]|uniref:Uncharacterized protein n=1 Tax=Panicum hallii var. hallii TaxID=1504633 RepID=A0A2T7EVC9_9POAL|nr:hypothetical protein GQ55_2G341600 [Panicum hallii var. hallii]
MRRLPSYRWTAGPRPRIAARRRRHPRSPHPSGDLDPVPWPVGRVAKAAMGWYSSNYWSGLLGRRRTDFLGCFFRWAPGGWWGGCITTSGFKFWAGPVRLGRQLLRLGPVGSKHPARDKVFINRGRRASCLRESKFSLMEKKVD